MCPEGLGFLLYVPCLPRLSKMPQRGAPSNRVHPVQFAPVIANRISLGYPPGVQLGWNAFFCSTGAKHIALGSCQLPRLQPIA
jgi:hypothetical protein